MSGTYIYPLKRIFLNLSGGTVTGDTTFTQGVFATQLSGGTIYSGSTELSVLIGQLISSGTSLTPTLAPTEVAFGNSLSAITGSTNFLYNGVGAVNSLRIINPTCGNVPIVSIEGATIDDLNYPSLQFVGGTLLNSGTSSPYIGLSNGGLNFDMFGGGGITANSFTVSSSYGQIMRNGLTNVYFFQAGPTQGFIKIDPLIGDVINEAKSPLVVVGNSFFGDNLIATAYVDINSASTSQASLRIHSGSTVISPNNGDFWNDGTYININPGIKTDYLSATTISGGTIFSGNTNLYSIFLAENDILDGGSF